jgi:hypothetical protein
VLTVFSKSLPLDVAARVWDAYLVYGDYMIWRAAIAVFKLYEPLILAMSFDGVRPAGPRAVLFVDAAVYNRAGPRTSVP